MKKIQTILSLLIVYSFILLPFPNLITAQDKTEEKTTPSPAKFALLVGINDYIGQVNDLSGTHHDVEMMKNLLISKEFGFTENQIGKSDDASPCGKQSKDSPVQTLCSKQATKSGIENAFKELIEKVSKNKGAAVVFFYSGHGYHIPDDDENEEPDGEDETIVPSDGEWDGTNQIRDDEFNEWTKKLREHTSNITFIFDSCHSGTITRGNGSKSFKGKNTPNSKVKDSGSKGDDNKRLNDGVTEFDTGYVTISGSLPHQESFEDWFPDPKDSKKERKGGVLTYFFVEYLKNNPNASYREVVNYVRNGADSRYKPQTPQAEGNIDNVVFGSTKKSDKVPIFPVCKSGKCSTLVKEKTEDNKEIQYHTIDLPVGELAGAREGGIIAIYDKKARALVGDEDKIGMGTISSATQFTSTAKVTITDASKKEIPADAKVILVTPNFTDAKRTVALDYTSSGKGKTTTVDAGDQRMNELKKSLDKSPYFDLSDKSDLLSVLNTQMTSNKSANFDWDIGVVRASFKDFKTSMQKKTAKEIVSNKGETPKDEDIGFYLSDKNGDPLYNFWVNINNKNAAADIQESLEKHVRLENLKLLGNEGSSLSGKVKVEFVRVQDFSVKKFSTDEKPQPIDCSATDVDTSTQQADNLKTNPQIKFAERRGPKAGVDQAGLKGEGYYFRITNNSTEDLHVYVYSLSPDGEIRLLLPPKGIGEKITAGETIKSSGENQCRVFFHTKAGSDIGTETFKFIVTSQEFPAELLTQQKIEGLRGEKGFNSPLSKLLLRARTQEGTSRGPEEWGGSTSSWTTVTRTIDIVP